MYDKLMMLRVSLMLDAAKAQEEYKATNQIETQ